MKNFLRNHSFQSSFILLLCYSGSTFAVLEEVVVTAQKREQSAQDIGVTVSSIDEESLREFQINDVGSLSEQLSNVQYYSSNNLPSFTLRGVGLSEFTGNVDAPVGIHVDEVYLSKPYMASMGLFDIERVDALSGPQGTLFGRNTTGGAVNFYTRRPTEEFGAGFTVNYGNFERLRSDGYVTGAIADNLSGRFAFSSEIGGGGPYDNLFDGEEVGKLDKQQFRGKLQWDDGDRLSIGATITGGYDKGDITPYKNSIPRAVPLAAAVPPNLDPSDNFTINQDNYPTVNNEALGGNLNIAYDFDFATLTSITAFNYFERDQRDDPNSGPTPALNGNQYAKINQFTQELRLTGDFRDNWRYVAGFFYEHDELDVRDDANFPIPLRFATDFEQEVDSFAGFLHNEIDVHERITLTGGIRYSVDITDIDGDTFLGAGAATGGPARLNPIVPVDSIDDSRTDNNLSFKAGVNFALTDDVLFYTNISTGYRAGGYALPFGGVITQFEPEEMTSFEMGMKSRLLDETLQLNVVAYRNLLDDVQVNVDDPSSPLVPITRNAGDSKTSGLEADMWWKPAEEWDIKGGLSYINAKIESSSLTITGIPIEGNRPINTPRFSYNGLVRYQRPLGDNMNLTLMTNFNWTGERYLELTNTASSLDDDYFILNVRAAISSADGRWELAAWGKNITDTEYLTYSNEVFPLFIIDIQGEPATYGVSLSYNFY